MLPTPRPVVAICWTCGQPGAHGSLDECLVVLRRNATYTCAPTAPPDPPPEDWIVVRYVGQYYCRIVFRAMSVTQAIQWIHSTKRHRGKGARHYYWMERLSAPASTWRWRQRGQVTGGIASSSDP